LWGGGVFLFLGGGGGPPPPFSSPKYLGGPPPPPARLRLVFFFVLLCAVVISIWYLRHSPHGSWDAWAIWNLRARFLYRGEEAWTVGFSPLIPWSHPDYPLLVPGAVARGWTIVGRETPLVPQGIACLFGAATVGVLMTVLALLRSSSQGYLGGLVLLSTPYFLDLMTAQYADVPLGFFFLASAALFEIHDREETGSHRLPFLAGVLTGLAAWTKNEGSLFLVATVVVRLRGFATRPQRAVLRELIAFALGWLPIGLVLIFFKLRYAPANDLVAGQDWQATRERVLDLSRYLLIAEYFLFAVVRIGPGAVVVLIAYRALLGGPAQRRVRQLWSHAVAVLVLMLAGYAFVYLTTPNNLAWHLHDSIDRLFMQLWPTALLAFFLTTASWEEVPEPQDKPADLSTARETLRYNE